VWEDAGVMPYSYDPVVAFPNRQDIVQPKTVDATIAYSKEIATLRPNNEFAMVAKGWTTLRWETEFEHHGPFILGERAEDFIRGRLAQTQNRWDYVNRQWVKNLPHATRFFSEVRAGAPNLMTVLGLIEDGQFEERIQVSAALLGEILWNPSRANAEILKLAMSPYYRSVP